MTKPLLQLLAAACVTVILSQERRDGRKSVWSCCLRGRDGFVVPMVLVGQRNDQVSHLLLASFEKPPAWEHGF